MVNKYLRINKEKDLLRSPINRLGLEKRRKLSSIVLLFPESQHLQCFPGYWRKKLERGNYIARILFQSFLCIEQVQGSIKFCISYILQGKKHSVDYIEAMCEVNGSHKQFNIRFTFLVLDCRKSLKVIHNMMQHVLDKHNID